MRKILSVFMALLLVCSLPLSALAIEVNVSYGDVTIGDTQVTHTDADSNVKTEDHGGSVTVTGETDEYTITVNTNTEITVTLDNVTVDNSDDNYVAGMKVTTGEEGKVTVELEGENTLIGGSNAAGLQTSSNSGGLEITDTDNNGSLTATGGDRGAGIGGGSYADGNNITITGGEVTANGGYYGAGIGGGEFGEGNNITISGGTVTATSGWYGAGIGGGANADGNNITITGGEVTSTCVVGGAGIGGGKSGAGNGIAITGGEVSATGGMSGAGIGGGDGRSDEDGSGTNITITGGEVTAIGGSNGAGIGGGICGVGSGITISGGAVTATGGSQGAGIGGGAYAAGSDVTISGGQVTATSGNGITYGGAGAGIGGGVYANGSDITISGGKVTAIGRREGAGIGGGYLADGEHITISGGEVTATGGTDETSRDGAGIGGGYMGSGSSITINGYAHVDAIGGGFAADSGDGAESDSAEKLPDNLNLALESDYYTPHSDDHGDRCGRYNDIYGCDGKEVPTDLEPEPEPEESEPAAVQDPYIIYTVDTTRWEEDWDYENGILTITAIDPDTNEVKEDAIFTTWGYGIDALMGYYKIKTVRFITANAERELDLAELAKLVRETGDEYDLIHKGSESTLMLNNVDVEERLLELQNAGN